MPSGREADGHRKMGPKKIEKKLQAECEERKEPEAVRGKETIYGSTAI